MTLSFLQYTNHSHDRPSRSAIAKLEAGDFVMLRLAPEELDERVWLEIEGRDGDKFLGNFVELPEGITDLSYGSLVTFEAHHIAALVVPDDPDAWIIEEVLAQSELD